MCRKLIFLIPFILVLGLVGSNVAFGHVIEVRIDAGSDDMEEYVADGTHDLGSSDLEITEEGGPEDNQIIGLRFNNIMIPQGAIINSAYVQFHVDETDVPGDNRPGTKFLRGEAVDNAATFSNVDFDIASRPTTAAEASWDWPEWLTTHEEGPDQQTSDISAVIQEIVDRPGWAAGNSLVLIITGSGENTAEAFEGEEDAAPLLHIEFAAPVSFAPIPADGAIEVDTLTLEWIPGDDALFHRVYLNTEPTFDDPNLMIAETDLTLIAVELEPGTTYYWRVDDIVDAIEDPNDPNDVEVVNTGDVWTFNTIALEAHFPDPYNGAKWIPLDAQLNWTAGKDAIMHDVYMDVNEALVAASDPNVFMDKVMDTSFDPGPLEPGTTYYWKVDEFAIGVTNPGMVWSFTATDPNVGGVEAEFFLGRTLAGKPVVTRVDKTIDFNWGSSAPDPNVPADNFSVRFNADFQVAVDGTYTLHGSANDGIRVYLDNELLIDAWIDQSLTEYDSPPLDLVAGRKYLVTLEQYENGGDAAAELRWSSDVVPKQIIPSGALMPPTVATSPVPANGAANVSSTTMLSWNPADAAVQHDVYLSTDADNMGDALSVDVAALDPGVLDLGTTYYWRVDEVDADGAVVEGLLWSFTVSNNVVIDDIEAYNDIDNLVFDAWIAAGGAIIGNEEAPYVDLTNVHGGLQAMPMSYDITPEEPAPVDPNDPNAMPEPAVAPVAEATLTFDSPQYWGSGVGGSTALDLSFLGRTPGPGSTSYDAETGVATIVGRGDDIGGTADQFQYAFVTLSGDGSMTVKVEDVIETNDLTKAGIMIRETLDAGSKHASVYMTTPTNGVSFQARPETDASSIADDAVATEEAKAQTEPVWLRLERIGDDFYAYYAIPLPEPEPAEPNAPVDPNAEPVDMVAQDDPNAPADPNAPVDPNAEPEPELEWIPCAWNPQMVPMAADVFIGLAVTSHSGADTYATAMFSNIESDGGVGDLPLTSMEIGLPSQAPGKLYAAVEDSTGAISIVKNSDADTLVNDEWANWTIDLSEFDVDLTDVAKLTIGVEGDAIGACDDPFVCRMLTDFTGMLNLDDIQLIPDVDMFDGTLDGWDHDNSVDRWDGSVPGEGNPGGAAALVEDDVTYLRIQDTGDPRDYGSTTPTKKTNYSIYLTQPTDFALDGAIIEFRARIATTGTLDEWRKDGGGTYSTGLFDWPAGGLSGSFDTGTHEDYGRGNIGIAEKGKGVISAIITTSGIEVGKKGNKVTVDDATQWNTYKIEIDATDSGYVLKASANGGDVKTFEYSGGTGVVEAGTYIAVGSPDISGARATAFDVDYIKVSWK